MQKLVLYLLTFQLIKLSDGRICESVRAHNSVKSLGRLKNCTVVEGNVKIVLMDNASEDHFSNLSYPELREITEYLLVYNVKGLLNLGQLFPNLEKIGGEALAPEETALVIFKVHNLTEIGLHSLKEISMGNIVIMKNDQLCYVDTVDWKRIMKWDTARVVISPNKHSCPECPLQCTGGFCWNDTVCQVEDTKANDSCHHLCVSGCHGPTPKDCYSCRGLVDNEGNCVEQCPPNMFVFRNRRCVTREECISSWFTIEDGIKILIDDERATNRTFVVFHNKCVKFCPSGFKKDVKLKECVKCPPHEKCQNKCKGARVSTVERVRFYKSCDVITGSMTINIKSEFTESVRREYEEGLGSIKEIEGSLVVKRSTVTDLNFFKSLTAIRGKDFSVHYALYVVNNEHLQELWDWSWKPKIEIDGKVFFHYNPKLCLQKIYELLKVSNYNIESITSYQISKESNGERFPCHSIDVNFTVTCRSYNFINISVPYITDPDATLLRYVVHYTKDPSRNLTVFDDIYTCSNIDWKTKDISVNFNYSSDQVFNVSLTDLSPDTQYVFYLTAYTTSNIFGKSRMSYSKTLPSTPSELPQLNVTSSSSSQIDIEWSPPLRVNGKLTNYVVAWYELPEDSSLIDRRNYCENPLDVTQFRNPERVQPSVSKTDPRGAQNTSGKQNCCKIKTLKPVHVEQAFTTNVDDLSGFCSNLKNWDASNYTLFPQICPEKLKHSSCESYIYSYIYNNPFHSTKAKIGKTLEQSKNSDNLNEKPKLHNLTFRNSSFTFVKEKPAVKSVSANSTKTSLTDLKHYTRYVVSVRACRKPHSEELDSSLESTCSKTSIAIVRTLSKAYANNITSEVEHAVEKDTVTLTWKSPQNPNGQVVAFEIEYQRHHSKTFTNLKECVPYQKKIVHTHQLTNLLKGKYQLRIRAVTLSGRGYFTPLITFTITYNPITFVEICTIILLIIGLGSILIFLSIYWIARRKYKAVTMIAEVNPNYEYLPDHYEVDREYIELGPVIGEGTFGKVFEGILKPENRKCAIKTVNDEKTDELKREFLREANVMKSLNEANYIVKLLGVVSQDGPPWVLMELMEFGDLKTYLRSIRNDRPLGIGTTIKMINEIADAMAYMETLKFVHRDLAARNCMVDSDLTVKVGDFGMARDIYETDYYRKTDKGLLPVRWMAPESLKDGEFTSRSDVWSFGVVVWEILTMGEQPYQGLSNEQVLRDVMDGMTLSVPTHCPLILKPILLRCWNKKPESRSTFMSVLSRLRYYHDEEFKKLAYFYTDEAEERKEHLTKYVEMKYVDSPDGNN